MAVAFVVCSAIGRDTGTAVQDCIGFYGGDEKLMRILFSRSKLWLAMVESKCIIKFLAISLLQFVRS